MSRKVKIVVCIVALFVCLSISIVSLGSKPGTVRYFRSAVTRVANTSLFKTVMNTSNLSYSRSLIDEIERGSDKREVEDAIAKGSFEILEQDLLRFQDRYSLPALERMDEDRRGELVESKQAIQRIQALGISVERFQRPEAEWKTIYNYLDNYVGKRLTQREQTAVFTGGSLSELNDFIAAQGGKSTRVVVQNLQLAMDVTLMIPDGIYLDGNGVRLIPGPETLDKAIILDEANDCAVCNLIIDGGCNYGIYVKNSSNFALSGNEITNVALKGVVLMGSGNRFAIECNSVHENHNGGIFVNGAYCLGLIAGNRINDNSGARNLMAGIVLCSMEIENIDTAYNEFKDIPLADIQQSPNNIVLYDNTVAHNHSSGIYSDSGYMNYYIQNNIVGNEKEGMCLDYGSFGNYIARNTIQSNGGRNRMSDEDLEADFILSQGRMSDGSSPAKLPGISLDNTAYNTVYGNMVSMNYGSGIKAVRSAYRNQLLCNQISDNNAGVSDLYHFFGVELSTDMNADEEVVGLDFAPCYENIVARNIVSGSHYAGAFMGEGCYFNDFFDNLFVGCTDWSMESLSTEFNSSINNFSNVTSRGIALSNSLAVPVGGVVY